MSSALCVALYNKVKSGLNSFSFSRVAFFLSAPNTDCGSSMIRIGLVAAITSIGLRERKASSFM